jgi:hypothetical protein
MKEKQKRKKNRSCKNGVRKAEKKKANAIQTKRWIVYQYVLLSRSISV